MTPTTHDAFLRRALSEDLGQAGDLTSEAVLPVDHRGDARIVTREPATIAGVEVATRVFHLLDPDVRAEVHVADGTSVAAGVELVTLQGDTRAILAGERTALNLLGRLCGIATATAAVVAAVHDTGCRVADTRKTTPTLRSLEKHAVRMGGGSNHRFGLYDAVLIKDNHVVAAGGVGPALRRVQERVGHTVTVEVEVDTLDQLREVIELGADVVLLDNMSPDQLRAAVAMVAEAPRRPVTEASGGITLDQVRAVAETGVDVISLGALTHGATSVDVALDLSPA